jgi:lipopolysaccharide/colanic/teichoic acid biosynthesis glycosyltransferase
MVTDMVKRSLDLVVSILALIVLSPVLVVIALAIKLDSSGPALFRQVRVGRYGEPFWILKFRTMVVDAEKLAPNVSPTSDPRITRVGRFLRNWYFDEFPQLVNVLRGDMSLVGPRPETSRYVAMYSPEERHVLDIRPGLVGPSTLANMDEGDVLALAEDPEAHYVARILHERVRLDLEYLNRQSLGYDVAILWRQFVAIVRR